MLIKEMQFHRGWFLGFVGILTVVLMTGSVQGWHNPTLADLYQSKRGSSTVPLPTLKISPEVNRLLETLSPHEKIPVIVRFKEQANLRELASPRPLSRSARLRDLITTLQERSNRTQALLQPWLQAAARAGQVERVVPFWIFNGMSLSADPQAVLDLAAHPEVSSITSDQTDIIPLGEASPAAVEANIALINAPDLWALGYQGEGMVIASLDTGVAVDHPDLSSQWRGGENSWLDPYDPNFDPMTSRPSDGLGHGTWTMGLMVGGSAGGTSIGVAPNAKWISVKIFPDRGAASATAVHRGFEWLLDPDGNPATDDAPHVVNNSWGFETPGCSPEQLEYRLDVQRLRAAGILPVFSAGNAGNLGDYSGTSPAVYPEAFAVGMVNNQDVIYPLSSRGPSTCDEEEDAVFPEITAPGVNPRTTDLFGYSDANTGTSLAAPHVTAGLALLLQAFPNLTPDEQAAALISTTVDLGEPGPDYTYGYGRLDLASAYRCLNENICVQTRSVPQAYLPLIFLDRPEFLLHLFFPFITSN